MIRRPQEDRDAAGQEDFAQPPGGGGVSREGDAEFGRLHLGKHVSKRNVAFIIQLLVSAAHIHLLRLPPLNKTSAK